MDSNNMGDVSETFVNESHDRRDMIKSKIKNESAFNRFINGVFSSSEIIGDSSVERSLLYFSIPILDKGLYYVEPKETFKDGKELEASTILKVFSDLDCPSIFLFQVGQGRYKKVFGGFASQSWSHPTGDFGDDNCFLFSLTESVKFKPNPSPPDDRKIYLWHNSISLSWGRKDLVLNADVNFIFY